MRYIGLALYAEGPTDYHFLCPLLFRLCADVCLSRANEPVEFGGVLGLNHPERTNELRRDRRVVEAAKQARGAWQIVFVHADGASDALVARRALVQPALDLLAKECQQDGESVAVIPVRESEAWALADGNAMRQVLGTVLDDEGLGLPALAHIESILDPKSRLNAAFASTNPTGLRKKKGVSPMLNALGESVSLDRLRSLEAFSQLESELIEALRRLHVIRP